MRPQEGFWIIVFFFLFSNYAPDIFHAIFPDDLFSFYLITCSAYVLFFTSFVPLPPHFPFPLRCPPCAGWPLRFFMYSDAFERPHDGLNPSFRPVRPPLLRTPLTASRLSDFFVQSDRGRALHSTFLEVCGSSVNSPFPLVS